ncbi:MAG: hypothetical protein ACE5HT_06405 [Gemmatimonadales bacterium]
MKVRKFQIQRRLPSWCALVLVFTMGAGLSGCDTLLDVSNPNNVGGDDLLDPVASSAVANGALFTVQQGYGYMLAPYSTVGDELHWIGSRDAWQELEFGTPDNPANEFTDGAFPFFAQGRWMADNAISILEQHQADGVLEDPTELARAYLYAAISYTNIADWMDDFDLSDRRESAPPIGEANMSTLYDTAIGYLGKALAIVGGSGSDLERNLLAMRARTQHAKGVWMRVGTKPINISSPLVTDAAAVADAQAALAIDNTDWKYQFSYGSATVWNDTGWQVNARLELRFSDDYIFVTSDDNTRDVTAADRGIKLQDPIDGVGDPRLDAIMTQFESKERFADLTVLSAREMYLIMAEDALARGVVTGGNSFESNVNTVRNMGGMSDWVDGGVGMPTAQDMLVHERRVNLFLQGRRLNDMYRFGVQSAMWQPSRSAVTSPGTFLPITKIELDANCFLNPDFACPGK